MTRTHGHDGSKHVYWKHSRASSNKLNKTDSHRACRAQIRSIFSDFDTVIGVAPYCLPKFGPKAIGIACDMKTE